jgi:hypothetical protein
MDTDRSALPLIDDVTVKDVFADFCTGLNFVHGNLHNDIRLGYSRSQHRRRPT